MWLAILFFIAGLLFKLRIDFTKWRKRQSVKHTKEFWYFAAMIGTTSGLLLVSMTNNIPLGVPVVAGMLCSWFWFLFDELYNLLRLYWVKKCSWSIKKGQYSFFYTGSNDEDDSVMDNFLQRLKLWQHIAIKLSGIILFTFIYFKYLWN